MSNETSDRMVNTGIADADYLKNQAALALEDAALKLRNTDVSAKGEDVKNILHDVEHRVNLFKAQISADYKKIEADYHKNAEPVEHIIIDHPIPSVIVATGIGLLLGMLIFKARN